MMCRAFKIFLLALLLLPFCTFAPGSVGKVPASTAQESSKAEFRNEKKLDEAIRQLNGASPARYKALCRLIDYAAPELFRVGSIFMLTEHNDWVRKAASAVRKLANNEQALIYCLEQGDDSAKQWAIQSSTSKKNLLPYIARLATSNQNNSSTKQKALERLSTEPSYSHFLKARSGEEKDPHALEALLPNEEDFNEALARLLADKSAVIRTSALLFIGSDGQMGINPKPNHSFNDKVFTRLIGLTSSASDSERANAAYALTRMRLYNPDRVRETFLRLSKDKDENVRWRCGYGLVEQRNRPDVDKMFNELIKNDASPMVRYMTIISLPDRSNFKKELAALAAGPDKEIAELAAQQTVPINSAAARAWIPPTSVQPFFLPNRYKKLELDHTVSERFREHTRVVQNYIDELTEAGNAASAQAMQARLNKCIMKTEGPFSGLERARSKPELMIVTAPFMPKSESEIDDISKAIPQEITVELENSGAPVMLSLQGGGRTGKSWKVHVQPGADLRQIMLSGNNLSKTSVTGNFSKSIPITRPDKSGHHSAYHFNTVYYPEQSRGALARFCMATFRVAPTTVQEVEEPKKNVRNQTIVVGPSNNTWRETFSLSEIEPLYAVAIKARNEKWRSKCKCTFPILVGRPADPEDYNRVDYQIGTCNNLQASLSQTIETPTEDPYYRQIAVDPKRNAYYLLGASKLFQVSGGKTTSLVPTSSSGLGEKHKVYGIVFDTKRDRLVVSGDQNNEVALFNPSNQSWTKSAWSMGFQTACYSSNDDSVYTVNGTYIYRLDAASGKLLDEGRWALTDPDLTRQICVDGNFVTAISKMFPCAGGFEQIATVVDKSDGSIRYRDRCYFFSRPN